MNKLIAELKKKGIELPAETVDVLINCPNYTIFNTVEELATAAVGGTGSNSFDVQYDIPGKGKITEVVVHRVTNGVSANYTDPYMRRRDPDTMAIADEEPTDKETFVEKYGYEFDDLKKQTFDWLKTQELAVFFYFAGREGIGVNGIDRKSVV